MCMIVKTNLLFMLSRKTGILYCSKTFQHCKKISLLSIIYFLADSNARNNSNSYKTSNDLKNEIYIF